MLTNPCQSVADEEWLKQNEKEVNGNEELELKLERRLNGNEKWILLGSLDVSVITRSNVNSPLVG